MTNTWTFNEKNTPKNIPRTLSNEGCGTWVRIKNLNSSPRTLYVRVLPKRSALPVISLNNWGPLKVLNYSKLILNYSFRVNVNAILFDCCNKEILQNIRLRLAPFVYLSSFKPFFRPFEQSKAARKPQIKLK